MKGGIGSASLTVHGITVAALVAVNAVGDVRDPHTGQLLAGARSPQGGLRDTAAALRAGDLPQTLLAGANTTIGVVATDAVMSKVQMQRLATMAHDGLARTVNPIHTGFDGDVMFSLATGTANTTLEPTVLGSLAAEVTAMAVVEAIRAASSLPGIPAHRERR
ncbi:MAG: hypothetical protein C4K60_08900 [Ideonella sp. MAG2]|nr:MAG: hypothetical protein C4K60_08900 [Ideonella sp. MAG2]